MFRTNLLLGLAVAVSALTFAASPVAAVTKTPLNTNLIKNGGAENGLANWQTVTGSNFTYQAYGGGDGLSKAMGNRINGGKNYFWTGDYDNIYGQCDDAIQDFKITGRNSQIDAHQLKVTLSAWVFPEEATDLARVTLTFGDQTNNFIRSIRVGSQGPKGDFVHPTLIYTVPAKTREITVRMYDAGSGNSCLAFFDKVSVKLVAA